MVSALQSVRLFSQQSLLKAMKQVEQQSQGTATSTSPQSALLSRYGIDTSSSSSSFSGSSTLASMLSGLDANLASTQDNTAADPATISDDITTSSFMSGLQAKLQEMQAAPEYATQAGAMLAALKAGTLTISDPANGREIKAWDTSAAAEKNTASKPATSINQSGWSEFLKARLTRGDTGTYAKNPDGSFVDSATGNNAYFGLVGDNYIYMTWPKAAKTA